VDLSVTRFLSTPVFLPPRFQMTLAIFAGGGFGPSMAMSENGACTWGRSATPSDRSSLAERLRSSPAAILLLAAVLPVMAGCSAESIEHPWLDLGSAPPHEILEVSGTSSGQLVILVPESVTREEVMALGAMIANQAPAGATVNARIFNDRATALNWRTAPGAWTAQHLLAVVTAVPETGAPEVRWVTADENLPSGFVGGPELQEVPPPQLPRGP